MSCTIEIISIIEAEIRAKLVKIELVYCKSITSNYLGKIK